MTPQTEADPAPCLPYSPPNTFPDVIEQLGVAISTDTISKRRPLTSVVDGIAQPRLRPVLGIADHKRDALVRLGAAGPRSTG
jgi:hypothetical protein